ncbi:hypothetical protein [Haloarcula salinisoli]|uniref:Uncharacterized protein n=1 Tax=Haloarcula salinisoli TaxID=2487746 RepID=A0A8J7YI17_9EURY|nr:hypothetical protein [Halomicroarcula salinisoli]MBX0303721.1 hypothetical protein [Halomicroarcula salinisoli]
MNDSSKTSEADRTSQRKITLTDAYLLGSNLDYLRLAGANQWDIGGLEPELGGGYILNALRECIDVLSETDIDAPVVDEMAEFGEKLSEEYKANSNINSEDGRLLEQKANTWFDSLISELRKEKRIAVREHGLFDVERVLRHPEDLFREETWNWLSERCQDDISQACRCLAVECTTASVMIALRAVEDRLRIWYEAKSEKELNRGPWGTVLGNLSEEYKHDSDRPAVLTDLSYLKDRRNEVSHPQESPNWSEAEETIYRVRGTIERIYQEQE